MQHTDSRKAREFVELHDQVQVRNYLLTLVLCRRFFLLDEH